MNLGAPTPSGQPGPVLRSSSSGLSLTPAGGTQVNASQAQVAESFQRPSPVPWDAHLHGTTTTTTAAVTMTTTTATTTSSTSNRSDGAPLDPALNLSDSVSGQAVPPWVQALPPGTPRGDACFRARYGGHVSLLDSNGQIATRFTRDPNQCHPHLMAIAERLAGLMKMRNDLVAVVQDARLALENADRALGAEQEKLELARSAALRMGLALDDASLRTHEADVAKASQWRDGAQRLLTAAESDLSGVQRSLEETHDQSEKRVNSSDDALNGDERVHMALRGRPGLRMSVDRNLPLAAAAMDPIVSVYALLGFVGGVGSIVANAHGWHARALLETVRGTFDVSSLAGQLLETLLQGGGYDAGHPGDATVNGERDVPMMATPSDQTWNIVVGVLIGFFLAHQLIRSGWLDL